MLTQDLNYGVSTPGIYSTYLIENMGDSYAVAQRLEEDIKAYHAAMAKIRLKK